jgi:threonine/homoserine/homoserine lactone efflux protein
MNSTTILLFVATVLPLLCTPGPDMLFIASQAISGDASAGRRATAGVCVGYVVHSLLVALGLAAIIATSPLVFEALRWIGVAYLVYLASRLVRSALSAGKLALQPGVGGMPFKRGFLTAVLNPKGMLIYFAILPQFMHGAGSATWQALILSAIFIGLCGAVYVVLSGVIASTGRTGRFSDRRRRWIEGVSGGFLLIAAGKIATG